MSAIETWAQMVQTEHQQSDRMRGPRPNDHWTHYAHQFKAAPRRQNDPLVERLRNRLTPDDTLLDIGAGGGRLALPLALTCRAVTAVEPSPSMCAVLRETAAESQIDLTIVESDWMNAQVPPADITLCSHVLYVIQNIQPFIQKLTQHTRRQALIVLFEAAPQSQTYPLWQQTHHEPRHPLPSLPHLRAVLDEMGLAYSVENLPDEPPRGFNTQQEAHETLTQRLYVNPDTPAQARLQTALTDALEQHPDGQWRLRHAPPLKPRIVSWTPQ